MLTSEIEKFMHDGWVVIDIPGPAIIHEFADMLQKKAREITKTDCTLSNVHEHVDDATFKTLHMALTEYFWEKEFSLRASHAFLPILKEVIGLDIMVQYRPYLRLARPNRQEDNIGYHRDTQYGQTPYELAAHIAFVDLEEEEALRVISGSHRLPEDHFRTLEGVKSEVVKGSIEHMLGKPYAPKRLVLPKGMKTEPLTMRAGQVAIFTPAIFHGQEINAGNVTRVTTDMRFVNADAKVEFKRGKTHTGYVPVAHSPIQQLAQEYYQAQEKIA